MRPASGRRDHSSSAPSDERGEDLAAEPARADAVPRVAGAVVDPRARHGREERQLVAGDVDRPAPRSLDARGGEPGQQPAQPLLGPRDRRRVVEEARVDPAAAADRPRAGAHQHAAVLGRPEVVEEHPAVGDRLAARPADLREQLRHRLGQDDVAAEGRQPAASRAASRSSRRSWRRRSPPPAAARLRSRPSPGRTTSTRVRSWSATPAPSAARRSARTSRAGWTVAASGRRTPRRKTGDDRGRRPATRALGHAELGRDADRVLARPRPAPAWSRPRASRRGAARRPRRAPRRPGSRPPTRGRARAPPPSPSRERSRGSAHQ